MFYLVCKILLLFVSALFKVINSALFKVINKVIKNSLPRCLNICCLYYDRFTQSIGLTREMDLNNATAPILP